MKFGVEETFFGGIEDGPGLAQQAAGDGDLMWGDYDLIFPLADLYAGRIF